MDQDKATRESMDRTIEHFDSKFRLVLLAARRAEQLVRGGRPKLELPQNKPVRLAMEEVQRGMVTWDYGPAPETEVETANPAAGEKSAEAVAEQAGDETETH
jgi:DNA-directed RNA polymerase omega subunit